MKPTTLDMTRPILLLAACLIALSSRCLAGAAVEEAEGLAPVALAASRDGGREWVIDFTRYDQPAAEPHATARHWSLLGQINQKQTRPQDTPVSLAALPTDVLAMIVSRYPELADGKN